MDIELVKDGKINIGMQSYIKESIEKYEEYVSRGVTSPATSRLFNMTEGSERLIKENPETLHLTAAKLLWVMKRSRPDIETVISFLCTRVKYPDIQDWGKMRRVLEFLNQTIGDNCVIGANNIYEVLTYVDTSYAIHYATRDYIGGCMMFGWGLIHENSSKYKLNTKISTESEVIRSKNYIQFSIWLYMYMEH